MSSLAREQYLIGQGTAPHPRSLNTQFNTAPGQDFLQSWTRLAMNSYTLKKAAKEGACDICFKATVAVLRNDHDWFYVCPSHIKDPGFCTEQQEQAMPGALEPPKRYVLHRSIWFLRESKMRERGRKAQVQQTLGSLPSVPK